MTELPVAGWQHKLAQTKKIILAIRRQWRCFIIGRLQQRRIRKKRGRQNRKKEQLPPTLTAWAWINPDIKLVHSIVDLQQRLVGSQKEERQ